MQISHYISGCFNCSRLAIFVVFAVSAGPCHALELIELEPTGPIARDIDELFWVTVALMALVLIPVFVMTAWFAWHYRATNNQANHAPEWDRSLSVEWLVWLIPGLIITILSGMTWFYSHKLDPFKPLQTNHPPLEIQVVALDWKWLFIYPKQNIASVNEMVFPVNRPLTFKITSNTVMNSFFIPRLGGQIYAMAGIETQLHLITDNPGRYFGENTQFSGKGFPYQNFVAMAVSEKDFDAWQNKIRTTPQKLDLKSFDALAKPSIQHPTTYYAPVTPDLFKQIIARFNTSHKSLLSLKSTVNHYGAP